MQGGIESGILEFMTEDRYKADVKIICIPDSIVEHGTPKELLREYEFDTLVITNAVRNMIGVKITV